MDADPGLPEAALSTFEQLCQDLPPEQAGALAGQLRDAAWRAGLHHADEDSPAGRVVRLVYHDQSLFSLVAGDDWQASVGDLIECLALDARAEDLPQALRLVRELSTNAAL